MNYRLSVALLVATHCCPGKELRGARLLNLARARALGAGALNPLVSLEHILDVAFQHEKIWRSLAIDLQSATIVPLDRAFNFLAIKQNNNHHCVSVDLLLVIENLRIGFVGRWNSLLDLNWSVLLRGGGTCLATII